MNNQIFQWSALAKTTRHGEEYFLLMYKATHINLQEETY
jgi:hypothetical protein